MDGVSEQQANFKETETKKNNHEETIENSGKHNEGRKFGEFDTHMTY